MLFASGLTTESGTPMLRVALLFCITASVAIAADDESPKHPDTIDQEGVPTGVVTEHEWRESKVYPKTTGATRSTFLINCQTVGMPR